MADQSPMVYSTILIDYFRKSDESNSHLIQHFKNHVPLYI